MLRIFLFVIFAFTALTISAQEVELTSSDIPILVVTTGGLEIPNEPKLDAHLGIINNGLFRNDITDPFNGYDGNIGIEIRGNGTADLDKVSYLFETRKSDGSNNNVELLGLPKENDWVLYAPWIDKSLIRNILTYDLANRMGMYSSRTRFVELIIDDEYKGVFVLMEKIKRDKNRVAVTKFDESNDDPASGGYIVRIDSWFHHTKGWESDTYQVDGKDRACYFQYVYPKFDDITEGQKEYISDVVHDFERSLDTASPPEISEAISDIIDLNSFADYFILQELSKNPDAYRLSTYFSKDVDGKIKMGPMWDHNYCYGNYNPYQNVWEKWEYDNHWLDFPGQIPFWWDKLLKDSTYVATVNDRWNMFRDNGAINCSMMSTRIDSWAAEVYEAQARNFVRWSVLGENSTFDWNAGPTYEDEVDYLKNWLCHRIEWLDIQFPNMKRKFEIEQFEIAPNPASTLIKISIQSPFTDKSTIHIYNLQGQLVLTEYIDMIKGYNEKELDISNLAKGVYIINFPDIDSFRSRKLVVH